MRVPLSSLKSAKFRDFPQTHDPEIDENGEAVDDYKLPETLDEFALETKV